VRPEGFRALIALKADVGRGRSGRPILANLYLHSLDKTVTEAGYKMVRYADDFVILARSAKSAQAVLALVEVWTKRIGLTLRPDKVHIGNCRERGNGFDFLGCGFEAGNVLSGRRA
jgi:RNA-directed DNA polymerase